MNFWRRNWYYIGGILFVALAFFMGFWGNLFSHIQVILIFSFMAMLVHQFEEYGKPGGFPSIVNIIQFKEKQIPDRYPFNQNLCFVDNVFTTYTFYIVPIFFPNLIWLALAQTLAALIQLPAHGIIMNIRLKSFYNPGLGATVFLQVPLAIYMIWYVSTNNLATGWDLYKEKMIEEITIKEIVTIAGYHRSTFYEYFVDIYDVLNQLEEAILENIKINVLDKLDDDDVLNDGLVEKIATVYDAQGEYISVLLGENGDPFFLNKIKAVLLPILTETFGLPSDDQQTSYILEFATSGIFAVITLWYKNGKNLPSQELAGLVRSMLMGGVFPMIQKYSKTS